MRVPEKIKYKYIFNKDYNPKYANGAYGGITARGEISVNFYYERSPLPNEQVHSVDIKTGKVGEVVSQDPEDLESTLVRVVENGIILNLNTAKEVVAWLIQKIQMLEQDLKKEKDGNANNE